MIFELARGRKLNNKDNRLSMSRTIGLILVPWKFDAQTTSIFNLPSKLCFSGKYLV